MMIAWSPDHTHCFFIHTGLQFIVRMISVVNMFGIGNEVSHTNRKFYNPSGVSQIDLYSLNSIEHFRNEEFWQESFV
jgi:hypothetical protein